MNHYFETYFEVCTVYCKFLSNVGKSQSRLQQLIDWCGGTSFDGCIVFDECHKAKHYVPVSLLYGIWSFVMARNNIFKSFFT